MTLTVFKGNTPVEVKEFTVGFLINREHDLVALVRKKKPAWQYGLLNGIGGKVEEHETPAACMVREFLEEAVNPHFACQTVINWERFASIQGDYAARCRGEEGVFRVHFYRAFTSYTVLRMNLRSNTSEPIEVVSIRSVTAKNAIPNLPWLLRMALDIDLDAAEGFEIKEHYLESTAASA